MILVWYARTVLRPAPRGTRRPTQISNFVQYGGSKLHDPGHWEPSHLSSISFSNKCKARHSLDDCIRRLPSIATTKQYQRNNLLNQNALQGTLLTDSCPSNASCNSYIFSHFNDFHPHTFCPLCHCGVCFPLSPVSDCAGKHSGARRLSRSCPEL